MFGIELSPYSNKDFITMGDDIREYFRGVKSYSIAPARVLGMPYSDYLRFARDQYNGTIVGKTGFPIVYFDSKQDIVQLQSLLNKYWRGGTKNL
jgi:hypothetical protein